MIYKRLLLLLLFCCGGITSAQSPQKLIDSLKGALRHELPAVQKAKVLADLAWYYNRISIDSAMRYGKQSIAAARALQNQQMIGQALSDYGAILYVKGDYDAALSTLNESFQIRKKLQDEEGMASLHFKMGNVYFKQFALQKAMSHYLKALHFYEKVQNAQQVGTLETNIAAVYHALKNYPKALEYLQRSEKYLDDTKQESELANTLVGIGNVHFSRQDTLQAFGYFERAVKLAEKTQNYPALGTAYNNLGLIYTYRKEPRLAIAYLSKSLAIRNQVAQKADAASSQLSLAINHNTLGEFTKAKPLLLRALQVFTKDSIREKMANTYLQLIPVYAGLGKVDSVNYYTDAYVRLVERNLNENVLKTTNELEAKYQTAKKEKQFAAQEAEAKRRNLLLLLVSLFAGFVALTGYLIYRQQRLKNRQQDQEHQLKLAISQIETQHKLQEQRLRISRDLHDNIGAQLTFIISSVDNIKYGFQIEQPKLNDKLDHISHFAKATIVELRDTIWAMNSESLTIKDLELRILNFVDKAQKVTENVVFKFEVDPDLAALEMSSIIGMNVYRTVQEAVHNAIKHAEASKISIRVFGKMDQLHLAITDDGKGFAEEHLRAGNGLGNMKKRIKELGGSCSIVSIPGQGTTVSLNINPSAS